jgi:hypothetical protein
MTSYMKYINCKTEIPVNLKLFNATVIFTLFMGQDGKDTTIIG